MCLDVLLYRTVLASRIWMPSAIGLFLGIRAIVRQDENMMAIKISNGKRVM